jgi:hypothetical protein
MKIFDSSNCGKAMSDERVQIEPANLPLWRRIQRALGFDRIFTDRCRWLPECAQRWRTGEVTMARAAES